jgi:hypothetical protein
MSRSSSSTSSSETAGVRRLLRRALLFSLPFCLYALFIFFADPFNFLGSPSPVSREVKLQTAFQLNPCLWKMSEFKKQPHENIMLGDSRMMALRPEQVKEITGEDFYNFAYGGASLQEISDTFWFATRHAQLKKVYVGLNLTVYNDYNYTERTKAFANVEQNPALYFVNKTVLQSALYGVYSQLAHADLKIGVPTVDREAFWREQLFHGNEGYYRNYVYPTKYKQELEKIARHCREHGIKLSFIIFPSHLDAQRLIGQYHLEPANEGFRKDLAALAPVYDFDYENEITSHKENFNDPNHYVKSIGDQLIREVWLDQPRYARKYQANGAEQHKEATADNTQRAAAF